MHEFSMSPQIPHGFVGRSILSHGAVDVNLGSSLGRKGLRVLPGPEGPHNLSTCVHSTLLIESSLPGQRPNRLPMTRGQVVLRGREKPHAPEVCLPRTERPFTHRPHLLQPSMVVRFHSAKTKVSLSHHRGC